MLVFSIKILTWHVSDHFFVFFVFQVMFFTLCAERPQCQEIFKNCDLWKSFIGSSGTFRTYGHIVLRKTHIDTNAAIREDLGDRCITDRASLQCPCKPRNGPSFCCVPSARKPSRRATASPSAWAAATPCAKCAWTNCTARPARSTRPPSARTSSSCLSTQRCCSSSADRWV